jgi:hypothetical protein
MSDAEPSGNQSPGALVDEQLRLILPRENDGLRFARVQLFLKRFDCNRVLGNHDATHWYFYNGNRRNTRLRRLQFARPRPAVTELRRRIRSAGGGARDDAERESQKCQKRRASRSQRKLFQRIDVRFQVLPLVPITGIFREAQASAVVSRVMPARRAASSNLRRCVS